MSNINEAEFEKIRNDRRLPGIGNLYVREVSESGKRQRSDEHVFDDASNNYHLYPQNRNDRLEKSITEKRKAIAEIIASKYLIKKSMKEFDSSPNDGNIYFYCRNSGKLNGTDCTLFKYIAAVKNGILYELNFMRFFVSRDNNVNCVIGAIQFDRVIDKSREKIMDRRVNRNGICYPTTYRGQSKVQWKQLINNNGENSFFLNPQVSFDCAPEVILQLFVEFIEMCDKERTCNPSNS